jgi:hypothetical protein
MTRPIWMHFGAGPDALTTSPRSEIAAEDAPNQVDRARELGILPLDTLSPA